MKPIAYSVILPVFLIILGIILFLFEMPFGVFLSAAGSIWLIISFLIGYKEDEQQPLGMGRGRQR